MPRLLGRDGGGHECTDGAEKAGAPAHLFVMDSEGVDDSRRDEQ
jgi:hypothetical protein